MDIDFFKKECISKLSNDTFGLCDDDGSMAYIDTVDNNRWIATVTNKNKNNINFIAVDKCIEFTREDGTPDNKCDVMMTYDNNIIFVELKNKKRNWLESGLNQLKTTISYFVEHHNDKFEAYTIKTSYLSNKQKPNFNKGKMKIIDSFKKETKTILRITTSIEI